MAYLECDKTIKQSWYNQHIILEINKYQVATIWLNRPDKHNALNADMVLGLNNAFEYLENYLLENRINIRVLLLRAKGKTFCAGADLKAMQQMIHYDYQENYTDALNLAKVLEKFAHFSCPTIAIIQGSAYGGGVGLICCADFAIALSGSEFCLSEVKLGIIPAVISPYIYKTIGYKQSVRYILTADTISSEEALKLNILSQIVNSEKELVTQTEKIVTKLLSNGPIAMQEAKKWLNKMEYEKYSQNLDIQTADLIAKLRTSSEGQEGLLAFLEKRKPNWKVND